MKIAKRSSTNQNFSRMVTLKVGMCLTARVDEDKKIIVEHSHVLPFPHFVYIVEKIKETEVVLIDTSHNNTWKINEAGLSQCELVSEDVHSNWDQVDCEFINRVLSSDED
jgi:hypothetical protein